MDRLTRKEAKFVQENRLAMNADQLGEALKIPTLAINQHLKSHKLELAPDEEAALREHEAEQPYGQSWQRLVPWLNRGILFFFILLAVWVPFFTPYVSKTTLISFFDSLALDGDSVVGWPVVFTDISNSTPEKLKVNFSSYSNGKRYITLVWIAMPLVALLLLRVLILRRSLSFRLPFVHVLSALLALQLLALAFASNQQKCLETIADGLLYISLMWLLANFARSKGFFTWVSEAAIFGGTVVGFLGILQKFNFQRFNEEGLEILQSVVLFNPYNGKAPFSTFGQNNFAGSYLGLILPLTIMAWFSFRPHWSLNKRFFYSFYISFSLMVQAFFLCGVSAARGGVLSFLGGASLVTLIGVYSLWKTHREDFIHHIKNSLLGLVSTSALCGILVVCFFGLSPDGPRKWQEYTGEYLSNMQKKFGSSTNVQHGSNRVRLYYAGEALNMMRDNPLIGIGGNNYRFYYPVYRKSDEAIIEKGKHVLQAHCDYAQYGAENGLLGFVLFMFFNCLAVCRGIEISLAVSDPRIRLLALGSCGSLMAMTLNTGLFFPYQTPGPLTAFIVALGLVFSLEKTRVSIGRSFWFALAMTGLGMFAFGIFDAWQNHSGYYTNESNEFLFYAFYNTLIVMSSLGLLVFLAKIGPTVTPWTKEFFAYRLKTIPRLSFLLLLTVVMGGFHKTYIYDSLLSDRQKKQNVEQVNSFQDSSPEIVDRLLDEAAELQQESKGLEAEEKLQLASIGIRKNFEEIKKGLDFNPHNHDLLQLKSRSHLQRARRYLLDQYGNFSKELAYQEAKVAQEVSLQGLRAWSVKKDKLPERLTQKHSYISGWELPGHPGIIPSYRDHMSWHASVITQVNNYESAYLQSLNIADDIAAEEQLAASQERYAQRLKDQREILMAISTIHKNDTMVYQWLGPVTNRVQWLTFIEHSIFKDPYITAKTAAAIGKELLRQGLNNKVPEVIEHALKNKKGRIWYPDCYNVLLSAYPDQDSRIEALTSTFFPLILDVLKHHPKSRPDFESLNILLASFRGHPLLSKGVRFINDIREIKNASLPEGQVDVNTLSILVQLVLEAGITSNDTNIESWVNQILEQSPLHFPTHNFLIERLLLPVRDFSAIKETFNRYVYESLNEEGYRQPLSGGSKEFYELYLSTFESIDEPLFAYRAMDRYALSYPNDKGVQQRFIELFDKTHQLTEDDLSFFYELLLRSPHFYEGEIMLHFPIRRLYLEYATNRGFEELANKIQQELTKED